MKTTEGRSTCSLPGRWAAFGVKFLLDHDVPDDLSYLLDELGHDVTLLRKPFPAVPRTKPSSSLRTIMLAYY